MTDVRVTELLVPMRDGTVLPAELSLPMAEGPWPVLLVRTPYGRAAARASEDLVGAARRGWAAVAQDVRGTGDAGGDFRPYHQEIDDGWDTLDWVASQDWCDGRIAMTGGSYVGATQWLAAVSGHPALRVMSPTVTAGSFSEGWTYHGGAFAHGFLTPWAKLLGAVSEPSSSTEELLALPPRSNALASGWQPYQQWLANDARDWDLVDVTARHQQLAVPALHVGGWYDPFIEGTLAGYAGMRRRAASPRARNLQRLIVGPWTHANLGIRRQGELDFGPLAELSPDELRLLTHQWLWDVLDTQAVEVGARVFVMGSNEWVDLEQWPPPAREALWYLGTDVALGGDPGRSSDDSGCERADGDSSCDLGPEPPSGSHGWQIQVRPDDPVPSWGGRGVDFAFPVSGPREQSRVENRHDVVVLNSAVLSEHLCVMGSVRAELWIDAPGGTIDVVARLCDVHPDGHSYDVVEGIRRVTASTPGPIRVTVDLGTTAMTFRAGHRLRLQLCGTNFPRFDLATNKPHEYRVVSLPDAWSYLRLPLSTSSPGG